MSVSAIRASSRQAIDHILQVGAPPASASSQPVPPPTALADWNRRLFYRTGGTVGVDGGAPAVQEAPACATCFDGTDERCVPLALALYVYLTGDSVNVVAGECRATSGDVRLVVRYDLAQMWDQRWLEGEPGTFHLIVVQARTLRVVPNLRSDASRAEGDVYLLPISVPHILRCWDAVATDYLEGRRKNIVDMARRIAVGLQGVIAHRVDRSLASGRPQDYQDLAVELALRPELHPTEDGHGTLLCMGTGTGKSRTSLKIVRALQEEREDASGAAVVVVAPATACRPFETAASKVDASWTFRTIARPAGLLEDAHDADVLFVPHSLLVSSAAGRRAFAEWVEEDDRALYLVVDEAHRANDAPEKQLYAALAKERGAFAHCLVLSATPFVNHPDDLRRMLRLASAVDDVDLSSIDCNDAMRNQYFASLGVSLVWLMDEYEAFPQVRYHRHTVEMRARVWRALKRLYAHNARAVVQSEFNYFRTTPIRGDVAERFKTRVRCSLIGEGEAECDHLVGVAPSSSSARTALEAFDWAGDAADLVQALDATDAWDVPFYENPVWLRDVFRTQSEQYTFRGEAAHSADDLDTLEFYEQDVAFTTDGAVDELEEGGEGADLDPTRAASCFEEALALIDRCVETGELPIVLHMTRLDPGVVTLHAMLLRHLETRYPRVSPCTVAMVTGKECLVGGVPVVDEEEEEGEEGGEDGGCNRDGARAMKRVQEYFERGYVDILLMTRVAREGTEFVTRATLTDDFDRARVRRKYQDEYQIHVARGVHTLVRTSAGLFAYIAQHPLDDTGRRSFKRRLPTYDRKPYGDDEAFCRLRSGSYTMNRLPPVRHFVHVGMQWNSANMQQAEARVARRYSHPLQYDARGEPTMPRRGELHVHTIVTTRPEEEGPTCVMRTYDERMEELVRQKDADIYRRAQLLATHAPSECRGDASLFVA